MRDAGSEPDIQIGHSPRMLRNIQQFMLGRADRHAEMGLVPRHDLSPLSSDRFRRAVSAESSGDTTKSFLPGGSPPGQGLTSGVSERWLLCSATLHEYRPQVHARMGQPYHWLAPDYGHLHADAYLAQMHLHQAPFATAPFRRSLRASYCPMRVARTDLCDQCRHVG